MSETVKKRVEFCYENGSMRNTIRNMEPKESRYKYSGDWFLWGVEISWTFCFWIRQIL